MKIETRLDDAAIEALVSEQPDLTELELLDCRDTSSRGMAHLAKLKDLRRLSVNRVKKAVDKAVIELGASLSLEHLQLSQCPKLSAKGTAAIAQLSDLRTLDLSSNTGLRGDAIQAWKGLSLERLSLHGCGNLDDQALMHATEMSSLRALNIAACQVHVLGQVRVTAETFRALPRLAIPNPDYSRVFTPSRPKRRASPASRPG